jgi:hypothetical protein
MREDMQPIAYRTWTPDDKGSFILHVRTRDDPASVIDPTVRFLQSIEPRLPFDEIHTLAAEVNASLWPDRTLAWLSIAFGTGTAALAALGVFATLSYAVAQSKREIGIRTALGASPGDVIRVLSVRPLLFACIGVVAGIGSFMFLAPTFSPLLYGISVGNSFVALWAPVAVLFVVLGALLASSSAALRVDIAATLREE